jgi:hypothetical protein
VANKVPRRSPRLDFHQIRVSIVCRWRNSI